MRRFGLALTTLTFVTDWSTTAGYRPPGFSRLHCAVPAAAGACQEASASSSPADSDSNDAEDGRVTSSESERSCGKRDGSQSRNKVRFNKQGTTKTYAKGTVVDGSMVRDDGDYTYTYDEGSTDKSQITTDKSNLSNLRKM